MKYSHRLSWDTPDNRLSSALASRRAEGLPVTDLTVSNPTSAGLPRPVFGWDAALTDPASAVYRPDAAGLLDTRVAIASYYRDRGVDVSPDDIVVTCSTSESYAHLFRMFADPGDEFLISRPGYPLFDYLAGLEAVQLQGFDLYYDGSWHVDTQSVEEAVTPRTRGIILVNPNNPAGCYLRQADWGRIKAIAARHQIPVIVDEVFGDYALNPEADAVLTTAGETEVSVCVLSGLSKVCGLPQMKVGWIVLAGSESFRRQAGRRLQVIGDAFLSVAQPMQVAAVQYLAGRGSFQEACRERLRQNAAVACLTLAGSAATMLPVEAGWYAVIRFPAIKSDEEWALDALRHGVYCHPGYMFELGFEACLVISLLTCEAEFLAGMCILRDLAKKIK